MYTDIVFAIGFLGIIVWMLILFTIFVYLYLSGHIRFSEKSYCGETNLPKFISTEKLEARRATNLKHRFKAKGYRYAVYIRKQLGVPSQ